MTHCSVCHSEREFTNQKGKVVCCPKCDSIPEPEIDITKVLNAFADYVKNQEKYWRNEHN